MAEFYKAVFACPQYNEREVWFVSSRKQAQVQLKRQICGRSDILKRYRDAEYDFKVTPVFEGKGDAGLDSSLFGHRT